MSREKLAVKLLAQDEETFVMLIEKYSRLLWKTAYEILDNTAAEAEVEDCLSEVFLKLWKNPEKFDYRRSNIKNYLVLLTRSAAIDILRKKSRQSENLLSEDIPSDNDIADTFIIKEESEQIKKAIEKLNPLEREVIRKRYYQDKKPSQISEEMDIPVKKVENNLYRAKLKLEKLIDSCQEASYEK